jgi:hypothetical protein
MMVNMSYTFSTRSMFLTITCIAISLASAVMWFSFLHIDSIHAVDEVVEKVFVLSPFWSQFVWAAYAIGRRKISFEFTVFFAGFMLVLTAVTSQFVRFL